MIVDIFLFRIWLTLIDFIESYATVCLCKCMRVGTQHTQAKQIEIVFKFCIFLHQFKANKSVTTTNCLWKCQVWRFSNFYPIKNKIIKIHKYGSYLRWMNQRLPLRFDWIKFNMNRTYAHSIMPSHLETEHCVSTMSFSHFTATNNLI